jgi:hypothetical protein
VWKSSVLGIGYNASDHCTCIPKVIMADILSFASIFSLSVLYLVETWMMNLAEFHENVELVLAFATYTNPTCLPAYLSLGTVDT